MLFGPADSSELSRIVMPTEPSAPVLITSAGLQHAADLARQRLPVRSTNTWPLATLIWPMSACAGKASQSAAATTAKPRPSRRENVFVMRSPPSPVFLGMKSGELNLRESDDDGHG